MTDETDDAAEPLGVTRWDPTPEPCADCGAETRRRWRRGSGFVCPDCVRWNARGRGE